MKKRIVQPKTAVVNLFLREHFSWLFEVHRGNITVTIGCKSELRSLSELYEE